MKRCTSCERSAFSSTCTSRRAPASSYNTTPTVAFGTSPFSSGDLAMTLSASSPWTRVTPTASYNGGARFFAGLASQMGVATLVERMRQLYATHAPGLVTTEQLERHLACAPSDPVVSEAFTHCVYGGTRPRPPPDCAQEVSSSDPGPAAPAYD